MRACSRVRAIKLTSRSHVIVQSRWGELIHNPSKDRLKAVSDGVLPRAEDDRKFLLVLFLSFFSLILFFLHDHRKKIFLNGRTLGETVIASLDGSEWRNVCSQISTKTRLRYYGHCSISGACE